MSAPLVLSLFPGIGLLDMAFELEGFCVVRGPDVLWGGDVRRFHPPSGVFDGVIGGPPCQVFSELAKLQRWAGREPRFGNLIPEFERCVREAHPMWFLMENVEGAPLPTIVSYEVHDQIFDNRWLGEVQRRRRRLNFGVYAIRHPLHLDVAIFEAPECKSAVTASHGQITPDRFARYSLTEAVELQGLPEGFLDDAPFTQRAKLKAVANGVPLPMGRAIARAVKRAMGYELEAA